jgi:hypothetical protein
VHEGENVNIHHTYTKPEIVSLAQAVAGLAMVCLVLVGILGTVYRLVAPDGLVAMAFERSPTAGGAALGSLLLLGACAWYTLGSARRDHLLSEFVGFAFAAAGALYSVRYLLQDSL